MNKINYKDINLRLLKDIKSDYQYLYTWYQSKEVYTYFEQRSLSYEEIVRKYQPRTTQESITPVYMIEYKNIPIGIIQYTKLTQEDKSKYHLTKNGYEIDIFIGNSKYYNLGIGTYVIKLLIQELSLSKNIFVMTPETRNHRAINCYKKVGFIPHEKFYELDTLGKNIQEKIIMVLNNNWQ